MTENRTDIPRPVVLTAIVVVLAAAVSAGIHAGLVPEHLAEMPLLGVSFIVSVLALLAIAAALAIRPEAQLPASLAAFLFAGLILAYAASRTTGLPVLEPEPERVDAIGIVTVAVQLVGLLAALWLTAVPTAASHLEISEFRTRGKKSARVYADTSMERQVPDQAATGSQKFRLSRTSGRRRLVHAENKEPLQ
jgi:hypothetical protein